MESRMIDRAIGAGLALAAVAAGVWLGERWRSGGHLPRAAAVTSLADDSFAVCTAPLDTGVEGFFMLDFETGDLSGGVLNPTTSQFAAAYKHNVLKDLGFKPGQAKNPKFLLVSGVADLRRGTTTFAPSVLYVTDSSMGTTVAYAIPWAPQQQGVVPLVPLDVARPRGGGGGRLNK